MVWPMPEHKHTPEPQVTSSVSTMSPATAPEALPAKYPVGRNWMEFGFILLYPLFLSAPVLNVVAGILAAYAVLSLTARSKLLIAGLAGVLSVGLSAIFPAVVQLGDLPAELSVALTAMTMAPAFALAVGFRVFFRLRSAMGLMTLVTVITVGVVFMFGSDAIDGVFRDFNELAQKDPALDSNMIAQLVKTLRWLTPALIATQVLLPMFLAWYLAPTIERLLLSGRSVALATSRSFHWLTLTQWRLPSLTLALVLLFGAGRLAADALGVEVVTRVCDNLLFVTLLAFSVTGFALVEYAFRRFRISWLMRGVFYFLALISALPGAVFLAVVGLIDTQFDLRNRMVVKTGESGRKT